MRVAMAALAAMVLCAGQAIAGEGSDRPLPNMSCEALGALYSCMIDEWHNEWCRAVIKAMDGQIDTNDKVRMNYAAGLLIERLQSNCLAPALCNDDTHSQDEDKVTACKNHGGIKEWYR